MRSPLSGAMIGFGFIAERGHLPAYLAAPDLFEIVAVADVCAARRDAAHRLLPRARIYSDVGSLLAAESRSLDFVDCATPPCAHATTAHAALECGLHVMCEKPIAVSAADARALLEHARKVKRVFYPSHNYKHAPVIKAIRSVLDNGELGAVRLVTLDTYRTRHALGVPEWDPHWRRMRATAGGGIAMDHGSHTFYLAFDWFGTQPSSISATMSTSAPFETEDTVSCTVTFPNGVAIGRLTWTSGFRKTIYTLHGERGAIKIEDDNLEVHRKQPDGTLDVETRSISSQWMDASHAGWFGALQRDFADAIRGGDWVGREARDAAACVAVIEAAYASARDDGRRVELVSP
jgi:predicted dehydrogenase